MIFEATCLGCGKTMGIELPNTMNAILAVSTAEQMSWQQRCKCGGAVVVQTYEKGNVVDN